MITLQLPSKNYCQVYGGLISFDLTKRIVFSEVPLFQRPGSVEPRNSLLITSLPARHDTSN